MTNSLQSNAGADFIPVFLKLPPRNIVSLKFTLESYEGLGIVRTLNAEKGEVVVLALRDTLETVHHVLSELEQQLQARTIPRPENLQGDWLLREEILPS